MDAPARAVLHFLGYELDAANAQLRRGTQTIALRPKTLAVLDHLAARPGLLVTKAELLDAVWADTTVGEWVLTSCVRELRHALADDPRTPRIIETVHRRGYRFIAPVEPSALGSQHSAAGFFGPSPQPTAGATRIVGREAELAELDTWLRHALERERQVGFIVGEAGIGKTTLVDQFLRSSVATLGRVNVPTTCLVAHGQCLEHHSTAEPYLPMLEGLGRLCAAPDGASFLPLLRRHAPSWLVQLPGLLDAGEAETLERRLGATTRERMLREMASLVEAVAAPLVLVLEDLHWSDHATLDLVVALAQRRDPAPLLVVGTYRPVDVILRGHPLQTVHQDLRAHGRCRELWLRPLGEDAVVQYLRVRCPGLPSTRRLARALHEHTDGNPLFLVNVVDYLAAEGAIVESEGQWASTVDDVAEVGVPEGLRQMVATQIDRLGEAERAALEAGSVAGRAFSAALVATALDADLVDVEGHLERLARREQLVRAAGESAWPDGTVAGRYELIHSLYRHVLYDRVPPARRRQLHQRMAARLEAGYGENRVEIAAELAFHLEAGGQAERAVPYIEDAAARAVRRGADRDAVALLERGIALIDALPRTPERTLRLIRLSLALGVALQPSRSFADPAIERAWGRARALSEETDDLPQLFQAVGSLCGLYVARARFDRAREMAEQIAGLMTRMPLPAFVFAGNIFIGVVRYHSGELAVARTHFEQALAFEEMPLPANVIDLRGVGLNYLALTLFHQGYPDQARERSRQAAARAARPFDRGYCALIACYLQTFLRDMEALGDAADEAATLGDEYGFPMIKTIGTVSRGRRLVSRQEHEAGIAMIREGIGAYRATGQAVALPALLASLAEAEAEAGHIDEALVLVAEARALVESTGEQRFEAELHRLEGEMRWARQERDAAERCLRRALEIARRQGARWWELRASVSLARLRQQQGKGAAARRVLAAIVSSFTEGLSTTDMREAHVLLAELSRWKSA